ncbi:hypothetical protein [Streptomyces mirabilis]|uniref:hypothetical protein n=1 Tax=Streptomyces mirabilis TaxID=68239 RepID=UPI0036CC2FFE
MDCEYGVVHDRARASDEEAPGVGGHGLRVGCRSRTDVVGAVMHCVPDAALGYLDAARAYRRPPAQGQVLRADDRLWLEHLRDHAMAAQACENLRAHWATEQERAADAATHSEPDKGDDHVGEDAG